MRKFLATLLALTVVMSLGVSAFATAGGPTEGSTTISSTDGTSWTGGEDDGTADINVSLAATIADASDVYNVTIAWTSMEFTYTGGQKQWNTGTHTETVTGGSWSNSGSATVTVTNHSNKGVTVSGAYADASPDQSYSTGYNGVTIAFTQFTNTTLEAGVVNVPSGTPGRDQTTGTLGVSGTPTADINKANVGTVTVTIAATA